MRLGRLLLVRHGETDWNRAGRPQGHTDIPLNDTGRAQARKLAGRLVGLRVDAIYTSDLARAAETARIVGAELGLEPQPRTAWRELHLGDAASIKNFGTLSRDGELVPALARAGGPLAAGGETFAAFQQRVLAGLDELSTAHPDDHVLVVSHGGTLKTLLAHLLGLDPLKIGRLSLRRNCSLSMVDFLRGEPKLFALADTAHLE